MTTLEKLANGFLQESLIDSALQNTLASMWSLKDKSMTRNQMPELTK